MENKKRFEIEYMWGGEKRWQYVDAANRDEVIERLKHVKDDVLNPNSKTHSMEYNHVKQIN